MPNPLPPPLVGQLLSRNPHCMCVFYLILFIYLTSNCLLLWASRTYGNWKWPRTPTKPYCLVLLHIKFTFPSSGGPRRLPSICAVFPEVHPPLLLDYVTSFPFSSHIQHLCPHSHSQQTTSLLTFLAKLEQSEENFHKLPRPHPPTCNHLYPYTLPSSGY